MKEYRIQGKTYQSHWHYTFNHDGNAHTIILFFEVDKRKVGEEVTTFNSKRELDVLCGSGIRGNQ